MRNPNLNPDSHLDPKSNPNPFQETPKRRAQGTIDIGLATLQKGIGAADASPDAALPQGTNLWVAEDLAFLDDDGSI